MSNRRKTRKPRPTPIRIEDLATLLSTHTGVAILHFGHDDGCPAIATQSEADCICSPDVHVVAPFGLKPRRA